MPYRTSIFIPSLLLVLSSHAASPRIDEGEWEFEAKLDIPGMPANMGTQRFKNCLNKNDPVPRGVDKKQDDSCKTTHQFVSSDTATWTVRCTHGYQVSETKGKGTYRGDTMEATQTTTTGGQAMSIKMTGRRIGPCKK